MSHSKPRLMWLALAGLALLSLACLIGSRSGTAIPAERPADFEVQTATPTLDPGLMTLESETNEPTLVARMADAPTHTPDPNRPPPTFTPLPAPTATLLPPESTAEITPTLALTQPALPTLPPRPTITPDPPLQGGDWGFEVNFIPWPNPYGEPCPGAAVAAGWTAFVEDGPYGSSCMNENLYQSRPSL
jgi:hypothetical protein